MIEKKILDTQIDNLSKFLSKFLVFFNHNRFFVKEISREQIKKDIEEKFLLYLTKFLDFQISYLSNMKTLLDIESIFIVLLCTLNTTSQIKDKKEPMSHKNMFSRIYKLNNTFGLNATSIAEITNVPRTTVLRKISNLEKIGILKKDKFKRYVSDDLTSSGPSTKKIPIMYNNIKQLSIFFSQCLETYLTKY